ncbi:hypothetical protein ADUPG1_010011 [Aduncisulcus paluster]|uniref:THIF-type NAD/FAD binding fold domain-containing protein n=1 Tax=Aduncisulcus paluster TaxID=2918883 RepID=A0ABQ5KXJ6_9EUKA|nr:hypothetical protein ADUPG1_010011 [Aduncisulcus paluster]|eukprot:gnl/Carplike_NY0171/2028_a2732_640.p1 GENE.gnl/Carplike_NY0171/2028_a2732_640~~gnl/Carplike_NY0171/2028_a2732_640.p1  ORF type:complete len:288 (+),score=79.77 gnl/Carplike_NY0171/2028_a2732_640:39-902(+)
MDYSRQLTLHDFTEDHQKKLASSSVLIVGCGGVGCLIALYLAGAGVKNLSLLDMDVVSESNLHRQIVYTIAEKGQKKATLLAEKVKALNPSVNATAILTPIFSDNAVDLFLPHDVVIDASDNVYTRYLCSDAAVIAGHKRGRPVPLISAASVGYAMSIESVCLSSSQPCYRCRHSRPPRRGRERTATTTGVLGPVSGIAGTCAACECIKLLCGDLGGDLREKRLTIDVHSWTCIMAKVSGTQKAGCICEKMWSGEVDEPVEEVGYRNQPPFTDKDEKQEKDETDEKE